MPNELISNDPIVARNFYLEIDGVKLVLTSVSGMEIELDVVSVNQNAAFGRQQHLKTVGGQLKVNDIQIERLAPVDTKKDPIWTWFMLIRNSGMKATERAIPRKNGSIVLYDSAYDEVGRFNFFRGWPSKIATGAMSTDSNDPMKESITLVVERLERIK